MSFLSLIIWTYILGPIGAVLAIPASLLVKAVLVDIDPDASWLQLFLGDEPVIKHKDPDRPRRRSLRRGGTDHPRRVPSLAVEAHSTTILAGCRPWQWRPTPHPMRLRRLRDRPSIQLLWPPAGPSVSSDPWNWLCAITDGARPTSLSGTVWMSPDSGRATVQ